MNILAGHVLPDDRISARSTPFRPQVDALAESAALRYEAMAEYNEMTGRPINDMLDEYIGNCIEAYLSTDLEELEELEEQAASA
jgi:hypothetical protein